MTMAKIAVIVVLVPITNDVQPENSPQTVNIRI